MTDLLELLPDEMQAFLADLGPSGPRMGPSGSPAGERSSAALWRGQPSYRARQVFSWLHRGAGLAEMTDLPAAVRRKLAERACAGSLRLQHKQTASDGAAKFAFGTADGHLVETVLIPHSNRNTVCVSSQIGCAYRCPFCATGRRGLVRDLTAGEIVEQVIRVQQAIRPDRVTNIVFMGMGEPLANYDAVIRAVRLLNHPWGLHVAARHIAISTCGLPEGIRRLAGEGLQVALAISLHAATDDLRNRLVPVNRKHPLAEVMRAAREWVERTRRKVAFQYVIIPGLNDSPEQARRLARRLKGLVAMVNLIPQNPPEADKPARHPAGRPDPGPALAFARRLRVLGMEVAVRRSRGAEVLGACGQLRERAGQHNDIGRAEARPME